jgi:UDP-D-galactose:(glucosyl)LPS alpha-1,3-D-galactosyltransferase
MAARFSVALASDERYAPGLAVAVRSLVDHAGSDRLRVYVVDGGLAGTTRSRLRASWPADLEVDFVPLPASQVSDLPVPKLPGTKHLNAWVFARLFLPELLPRSETRVLYLDTDVLVTADVVELASTRLGSSPLGAVRDEYIPTIADSGGLEACGELGLDGGRPYFNSGVLLMDLPRWRAEDLAGRVLEFVVRYGAQVRLPEQDGLNAILGGRFVELDPAWNVLIGESRKFGPAPAALDRSAKILHFVGAHKPWQASFPHLEYSELYRAYQARTAWAERVAA